ncbi:hypothetical protein [Streptomyces sp. MUSC 14]|uniref:restriction endonuclease-related protein n=1 Tax=Streptomyces sp. MUSC 14 TaxID=1354889 RepID=UPI0011603C5C|nr:hypothetical protein [Streptomyces sp. MUSC 14]
MTDASRAARLMQVSADLSDDYMTVQLLAAGLARIQLDQLAAMWSTPSPSTKTVGLPPAWNAGVNRLWWRALEGGTAQLPTHMDVFGWCSRPLGQWPLALGITDSDRGLLLVEDGRPSAFADEAARFAMAKDPEAELVENHSFELLMSTADRNADREAQVQENYVELRGFLIDKPVASDLDLMALMRRFPAKNTHGQPWVKEWFLHAYQHRPASGTTELDVCDGCDNPLPGRRGHCGTPGCGGKAARRAVEAMSELYVQRRAVRRFFHDPGLAERRVFDAVRPALGERMYPWWGMDAVDVAFDFDGTGRMGEGEWWAADVKNHASATLLGRNFRWDRRAEARRRFLVIAQHRFETRGYVDDLEGAMDGRAQGVEVVGEDDFIAAVLRRASERG